MRAGFQDQWSKKLVLASRSEEPLRQLNKEINGAGCRGAICGGDTWVDNAGVTIFGKPEQVPGAGTCASCSNPGGLIHGSTQATYRLKNKSGAGVVLTVRLARSRQ